MIKLLLRHTDHIAATPCTRMIGTMPEAYFDFFIAAAAIWRTFADMISRFFLPRRKVPRRRLAKRRQRFSRCTLSNSTQRFSYGVKPEVCGEFVATCRRSGGRLEGRTTAVCDDYTHGLQQG